MATPTILNTYTTTNSTDISSNIVCLTNTSGVSYNQNISSVTVTGSVYGGGGEGGFSVNYTDGSGGGLGGQHAIVIQSNVTIGTLIVNGILNGGGGGGGHGTTDSDLYPNHKGGDGGNNGTGGGGGGGGRGTTVTAGTDGIDGGTGGTGSNPPTNNGSNGGTKLLNGSSFTDEFLSSGGGGGGGGGGGFGGAATYYSNGGTKVWGGVGGNGGYGIVNSGTINNFYNNNTPDNPITVYNYVSTSRINYYYIGIEDSANYGQFYYCSPYANSLTFNIDKNSFSNIVSGTTYNTIISDFYSTLSFNNVTSEGSYKYSGYSTYQNTKISWELQGTEQNNGESGVSTSYDLYITNIEVVSAYPTGYLSTINNVTKDLSDWLEAYESGTITDIEYVTSYTYGTHTYPDNTNLSSIFQLYKTGPGIQTGYTIYNEQTGASGQDLGGYFQPKQS